MLLRPGSLQQERGLRGFLRIVPEQSAKTLNNKKVLLAGQNRYDNSQQTWCFACTKNKAVGTQVQPHRRAYAFAKLLNTTAYDGDSKGGPGSDIELGVTHQDEGDVCKQA